MSGGHDAAHHAATSAGAPDSIASSNGDDGNGGESEGESDTVDGALSPGSTATGSPTGSE